MDNEYTIKCNLTVIHPSGHSSRLTMVAGNSIDFLESLCDALPARSVEDVMILAKIRKTLEAWKEMGND